MSGRSIGAAVAAATEVPPGRYGKLGALDLYEFVVGRLLAEWQFDTAVVDGLLTAPAGMAAGGEIDIFVHERLADSLGIRPSFAQTMNAGGATYGYMVDRAARAIAAGRARAVLCVGAGKFPSSVDGGSDAVARLVCHPDYEYIYGAFAPALYALSATRYMHEYGLTRDDLSAVAVTGRRWALQHPDALMRSKGPITAADVERSRPIASPFHLLDCSVPCEGGAALLVAEPDLAREICGAPAYILGIGESHDHAYISQAREFLDLGATRAAEAAYQEAGLAPADVTVAQIYDAFSINPILFLEATGLAERGLGARMFTEGHAAPGGKCPVNTYGGLLSFGHTGDASGMSMIVEGAVQVMGRAGARQVRNPEICLVHTYGGLMAEHCTIILGVEA